MQIKLPTVAFHHNPICFHGKMMDPSECPRFQPKRDKGPLLVYCSTCNGHKAHHTEKRRGKSGGQDRQGERQARALLTAAKTGDWQAVEKALKGNASNTEWSDTDGWTALIAASHAGHAYIVHLLNI